MADPGPNDFPHARDARPSRALLLAAARPAPASFATLVVPALLGGPDSPTPEPPWEARQWLAFGVYVVLLVALVALAWRLARPEADEPPTPPRA